jgi:hypothetical protein
VVPTELSYEGIILLGKIFYAKKNDMNLDAVDESKSVYGGHSGA